MFVTCLNELEKDDIVARYTEQDQSQSDIASAYQLSRRTIQRVLQERGILGSTEKFECTAADKNMLAVVTRKHGIQDVHTLDQRLSRPVMSHGNVLAYLCSLDDEVFERHFDAVRQARAMKPREAANG